eukprot:Gregarina_sp_Poly_1__9695@NODE_615_length_7127_cov_142_509207_g471_i0_p1_GENE_NODE_615_length_7127_cov_142_509207_g471_i0NODE_615_length_7127_cov_142_509207_g471_i0_p1_ORF_typecomplete_len543_score46_53Exo_endo_phos/PF03372_23/8_8e21_NODE_615_length_7127_cov_142_509207_g471_i018463474
MKEETRNNNILKEITFRDPDIITLQEIEQNQHKFFLRELERYEGTYVQHAGSRIDGVSCLYKSASFKLVEWEGVQFEPASNQDTFLRGQIVVLEHISGPKVLVANCHLVFNFSKSALKMAQVARLVSRMHWLRLKYANSPVDYMIPKSNARVRIYLPRQCLLPVVVFCGDFNLTPVSAIYSWITTGVINEGIASAALEDLTHSPSPKQRNVVPDQYKRSIHSNGLNRCVGNVLQVGTSRRQRSRLLSGQAFMFAAHMSILELRKTLGRERADDVLQQLSMSTTLYPRPYPLGDGTLLMPQPRFIVPSLIMMSYQPMNQAQNTASVVHRWIRSCAPTLDDLTFRKSIMLIKKLPQYLWKKDDPATILSALDLSDAHLADLGYFMNLGDSFCLPILFTSSTALPDRNQSRDVVTEPYFTVFQGRQRGTVDYIFYTFESLQLVQHLALPSPTLASPHGSIPNQGWPLSDHFSLMADFRFRLEMECSAYIYIEVPDYESHTNSPSSGHKVSMSRDRHPHQALLDQAKIKRSLWADELRDYHIAASA